MKPLQRGTAIVEFALVLPLLLLLTMTTTEFGRAIYQYNTIVKSLRDATRYLSMQTPNTKLAEAKNLVVFGNIAGTGQALVPGLTVAKVSIPPWQLTGSNPVINTVKGYRDRPQVSFHVRARFRTGIRRYQWRYYLWPISATMRGSS
jgi:Flp pilus assembly protein TadG